MAKFLKSTRSALLSSDEEAMAYFLFTLMIH